MQEVPALFRNGDAYTDSFEALLRNGLIEREDICKPDMNKLFDDIVFDKDRELRVLAIGAGKGGNDLPIIDALTRHRSTLHYTVVEPFHRHVDFFKSMVQKQGDKWNGVKFMYHIQTIQEFTKDGNLEQSGQFDIIHALHCMYHFPKDMNIFLRLYDALCSPGVLLLRHGGIAPGNGWRKMMTHFYKFYNNDTEPYYNFDLILKSIQEQLPSVEIKTTYRDTGSIDITKCFIADSEEGNKMLNYLFQCVDFRKFLSRERTEYFLSYLKDECCVVDGDNIYLPAHEAEIVIMK